MAVNILIGKSRHQSRSDREREKLQAQITTYALRFWSEHDQREQTLALARLQAEPPTKIDTSDRLDTFIEQVSRIVDVVLPARVLAMILFTTLFLCGRGFSQTVQQQPNGEVQTQLSDGIPYSCDTLKDGRLKCGLGTDIRDRDEEMACWSAIKAAKKSHDFKAAHTACDSLRDTHSREWYGKRLAKAEAKD